MSYYVSYQLAGILVSPYDLHTVFYPCRFQVKRVGTYYVPTLPGLLSLAGAVCYQQICSAKPQVGSIMIQQSGLSLLFMKERLLTL